MPPFGAAALVDRSHNIFNGSHVFKDPGGGEKRGLRAELQCLEKECTKLCVTSKNKNEKTKCGRQQVSAESLPQSL